MGLYHFVSEEFDDNVANFISTVVPGFSVLGFRALPGFRALCTGNQIWIYAINLPGFSALTGFKAPFHSDGQSALNPGSTVLFLKLRSPQNNLDFDDETFIVPEFEADSTNLGS